MNDGTPGDGYVAKSLGQQIAEANKQRAQPIQGLPRWQCHKVVGAAPILAIRGTVVVVDVDGKHVEIDTPAGFGARGVPATGDYLVVYEDGYMSHSPKATFEAGYSRVNV